MNTTALKHAGIYVLRPPGLITARLDQELLVLLTVRYPKVIGAVLYRPDELAPPVSELLQQLLDRMQMELGVTTSQIQVKLAGMSRLQTEITKTLVRWTSARNLRIVAVDLGKFVRRNITIDCEKGMLGVHYEEKSVSVDPVKTLVIGSPRPRAAEPGR